MTPSQLYADVRLRMTDLVRDLPEERQRLTVPGCPAWDVHALVAHVTGILADVAGATVPMDAVGADDWTQAQVDARQGVPLNDVLDEWSEHAATVEPRLDEVPKGFWRTLLIDLVTHEHDLRGALGVPGGRDSEAYVIGRKGFAVGLAKALDEKGVPGLRLVAPDWTFDAGTDPQVTATAPDSFEFFRALAGRRGLRQVLAWNWSGDAEPYLPFLNHFGPVPEHDVVEA
jgi:uncharacterized protein (TIGR03083 family)